MTRSQGDVALVETRMLAALDDGDTFMVVRLDRDLPFGKRAQRFLLLVVDQSTISRLAARVAA